MKKTKKELKPSSIKPFKTEHGYEFPFEVLDKTPGGSNLGRIQWCVEMYPAPKQRGENRKRLSKIWVWAKQTRDKRYASKVFEIPTYAESLTTDASLRRGTAFAPWKIDFCEQHKGAVILDCYPTDGCKKLVINNWSSISIEVNFE
ncbi:MAG: hypothetical protein V4509_02665 [Patescibacteria group bacterium]